MEKPRKLSKVRFYDTFRYYLIQKAKEAKTIGIVAGTLGVGKVRQFYGLQGCKCRFMICPSLRTQLCSDKKFFQTISI